ncbi:hypothetical protein SAMN05444007_102106 [Cribrihabitans marinus]|uniref:Rap1a immunity protein domain-containing protein n=1 Tax=Cribrihabitans marinus TaxID=1227549 RepID=A0A1H6SUW5_9RHOB|nr:hypothetical protein [Cribrihabitans marinus]GGH23361.1 hypothetical protein GCM10010973_09190 [Cribrihabitans marinus]SEI67382.1 hypothetical protein SAMN05444007_102106 [Cribrihabitans marinus]
MRPAHRIATLALATLAWFTGSAGAGQQVYDGTEAEALKCAAFYAYTAQVFESHGMMSAETGEEARLVASFILLRHVGGTEAQRNAAYRKTLDGMSPSDWALVENAAGQLAGCRERFLTP